MDYEILLIEEQQGVNAAGKLVTQMVIHYRTMYGDTGTLRMDKDVFTAQSAREAIAAEVEQIAKLRGIK